MLNGSNYCPDTPKSVYIWTHHRELFAATNIKCWAHSGAQFTQMGDEISVLGDFQGVAMQSHGLPDLVLVMALFQARVWANAQQSPSQPTHL